MYNDLIKRLRDWPRVCAQYDGSVDQLHDEAADAITELCNLCADMSKINSDAVAKYLALWEKQPRWIPVTERLPDCFYGEEIGNVEWISHGKVYAGCFGRGGKFRDVYFRVWNDATDGIDAIDAEYWRFALLPEPPKEE